MLAGTCSASEMGGRAVFFKNASNTDGGQAANESAAFARSGGAVEHTSFFKCAADLRFVLGRVDAAWNVGSIELGIVAADPVLLRAAFTVFFPRPPPGKPFFCAD